MKRARDRSLGFLDRLRLALRIWYWFAVVRLRLWRASEPLPVLVERLGRTEPRSRHHPPRAIARAVNRALRIGGRRPRCLVSALVFYRLLREQGDLAEVVIGLEPDARGHQAHAWVEIGGVDMGPPPGRSGHESLARFG